MKNALQSFWLKFGYFLEAFGVLSKREKKKIALVTAIQVLSGFLDLLGVAIIGVLGAVSVIGMGAGAPGDRISRFLEVIALSDATVQEQVLYLGIAATIVLVFKTALSVYLTRRTLFFLSNRGAELSKVLISKVLNQEMLTLKESSTQETLYAVTTGVNLISMGVLGNGITMFVDASLLLIIFSGLLAIDPLIAVSTIIMFATIGMAIYKFTSQRARFLGQETTDLTIESSRLILEVIDGFRENLVRGTRYAYSTRISELRGRIAGSFAEIQFMPYVGKYIIEVSVILGALLVCGMQFALQDAKHAVATLAVFLAAGTRIAPAVLRIQQGAIQIRLNLAAAQPTLKMIDELSDAPTLQEVNATYSNSHPDFCPELAIDNVSLNYKGSSSSALNEVCFHVEAGATVAIVGPSGAGKTSLVDVILGVITPDKGNISISGKKPREVTTLWPGAIAYVPQEIYIAQGSIKQNVALGFLEEDVSEDLVWKALAEAHLSDFVLTLPNGVDTEIGERGHNLSGGQRQRLGIARALFTSPKLLVLDEATSALDGQTETDIGNSVEKLRGHCTVLTIAHRLSTVRNADLVVYMERGRVLATGDMESVRRKIPTFDAQAKLMGL
jgi:ABC-type multidrug transport system fused ATPase/permease subunit